jgi:hypothetical protein
MRKVKDFEKKVVQDEILTTFTGNVCALHRNARL